MNRDKLRHRIATNRDRDRDKFETVQTSRLGTLGHGNLPETNQNKKTTMKNSKNLELPRTLRAQRPFVPTLLCILPNSPWFNRSSRTSKLPEPKWLNSVSLQALAAGSSKQKQKLPFADRTANAFFVPKSEIEENAFDLSINRYKEIVHKEEQYDSPKVIIGRLKKLEAEIANDLAELERMLG